MSGVRQVRQKGGLAEQESPLGNSAKEEGLHQCKQVQVLWGEHRDAAHYHREKVCAAKAQLDLKLLEMWGTIKEFFQIY